MSLKFEENPALAGDASIRLRRLKTSTKLSFFNALARLDGCIMLMFVMLALFFGVSAEQDNAFIQWMDTNTIFHPEVWQAMFLIGAILIALTRPGPTGYGFILVSPVFLFFYYTFRFVYMQFQESGSFSPLLIIILGMCTIFPLVFFLRTAIMNKLFETVVDLKVQCAKQTDEINALRGKLALLEVAKEQPVVQKVETIAADKVIIATPPQTIPLSDKEGNDADDANATAGR